MLSQNYDYKKLFYTSWIFMFIEVSFVPRIFYSLYPVHFTLRVCVSHVTRTSLKSLICSSLEETVFVSACCHHQFQPFFCRTAVIYRSFTDPKIVCDQQIGHVDLHLQFSYSIWPSACLQYFQVLFRANCCTNCEVLSQCVICSTPISAI